MCDWLSICPLWLAGGLTAKVSLDRPQLTCFLDEDKRYRICVEVTSFGVEVLFCIFLCFDAEGQNSFQFHLWCEIQEVVASSCLCTSAFGNRDQKSHFSCIPLILRRKSSFLLDHNLRITAASPSLRSPAFPPRSSMMPVLLLQFLCSPTYCLS